MAEKLATPAPDERLKYATILDCFAKGLAQVHFKNGMAANQLLTLLQSTIQDCLLAVRSMPFNAPLQMAAIAAGILKGKLYYTEGKNTDVITALKMVIVEEDKLIYREPQEWLIPARQYLGALLLKMKQPALAEKLYREDLLANPTMAVLCSDCTGRGASMVPGSQITMAVLCSDCTRACSQPVKRAKQHFIRELYDGI